MTEFDNLNKSERFEFIENLETKIVDSIDKLKLANTKRKVYNHYVGSETIKCQVRYIAQFEGYSQFASFLEKSNRIYFNRILLKQKEITKK